ncbi:bifunctional protein-serine/threonine kinase/phosphatase [Marinobacter sp. F4206]|uniref:bifunctional protein-serine/threonine kinase/phosphatase n=1 Tax=Marinobacter sp. F4206 TaxID=2861777 RepID=UPI001C5EC1C5|nr:bifunctional protein-serine/threonine kinase/phosphatase [Marinobacter sp. F4206]MBW4935209.1 bifunctional protein-serine/threonine kinase/phosphatase [Marinobacter sp. F4206]
MTAALEISVGQYSDKGLKAVNQDFHGLMIPDDHQRVTKGIAIAIADGISSSNVSQVASESAVAGFLSDYFSTPETWSVKQSAQRVLRATNAWLHAQTRQSQYRYDRDRGYVCTLSVMVLKSTTAHIFNVGDSRVYRVQNRALEQLSTDHRLWLSRTESCLTRAMGMEHRLDIDYRQTPLRAGDLFLLTTDGIYEHLPEAEITRLLQHEGDDLTTAAQAIARAALAAGSDDNLTVQIVRIDAVPDAREAGELYRELGQLPFAPELTPGQIIDGYRIVRQIHASGRSHVFQAVDEASETPVVIKTPSMDLREDPQYLEQFAAEEWIARRISNPHVVRPFAPERPRSCMYLVTHFVAGRTLKQWMLDHPAPDLETVRGLIEQVGRGLRAFHRLEMVHQDLKPENILVDAEGTVTLIDFGATRVAGLQELNDHEEAAHPRGAALYSAPETFLGEPASWRADQFSLAVIAYQLLTGRLPYEAEVPRIRNRSHQRRLTYQSARPYREDVPVWVDDALGRALHPEPHRRYPALSEFLHDLRQPGTDWQTRRRPPLMERHPVTFWQSVSALLFLALLATLAFD